jgi:hypothetical protein
MVKTSIKSLSMKELAGALVLGIALSYVIYFGGYLVTDEAHHGKPERECVGGHHKPAYEQSVPQ